MSIRRQPGQAALNSLAAAMAGQLRGDYFFLLKLFTLLTKERDPLFVLWLRFL